MMNTMVPHASDSPQSRVGIQPLSSTSRRGKNASATGPQHGGARFPTLAAARQLVVDVIHDHEGVAVHDRTVIAGTQLGCEVAGATAEQRWQFVRVVVDQPARDDQIHPARPALPARPRKTGRVRP